MSKGQEVTQKALQVLEKASIKIEDAQLLAQFRQGEQREQAFNQLLRKYQQRTYFLVRKMVIDHDDADDVVQEVFIKVWKNLDSFEGNSQLFTWIYRIATNECLRFLERKKKKRFWISMSDASVELASKLDTSPHISGDEVQKKLQKALLKLPDKQRLVFNLKYFEDLKYEEMAEITGTSVGSLKASYHHAVKKIEDDLNTQLS
jgi:RNA polymerase sigma-70 factor (family 1)